MSDLALQLSENGRQWLIHTPLEIGMYVLLAVALRFVLHKAIDRLVRGNRREGPPKQRRFGLGSLGGGKLAAVRRRDEDPARAERNRESRARRAQRAETIGSVLKSAVSFLVLIWVVIQSLAIMGVNVAPLIASAGVVGVALGFGAQNLVRDFISGIFMLIEDQYGVGDVVDVGDVTGTVETVGMRITTIRDVQGTLWYVRNGEIVRVANFSQDYAVAFLQLPISYTADVDLACRVAEDAAVEAVGDEPLSGYVLGPPEMLGVDGATADRVSLRLTVRVRANQQWAVERELRRRILRAFDDNGIAPPYRTGIPVSLTPNSTAE
ncbi:mechanosensitive ion channel family protein [Tsukamurella sp. 1534]|uniref:mechanosensitive ion channel family protein n=1 Tax=Tsukamurella sp. 1534 TaxID=1151061 RepID=UPI000316267E|nr:mechanosensitive ion channel domain-containing protein [Tsukamurella sp. 1534]